MRELLVPIGIIAVLTSMVLPLPPALIDLLLVGNLLFALGLLLTALYLSEPIRLSSLPTLILLATLYRLSLNIATTRAILGAGDGGRLVETFGSLVIGGNIVVGLIVFLLLTLVQFIVIAKGAERVAEVAARFTLDALPGKQMSIDADVRAGLIGFEAAREKRQELQTESRFYGALDGAMKFIKGDAIAGIVITTINVVGGLLIGLVMHQMAFSAAVSKYSVLSVGDGLISQIPALLNSIAAGIVITRVTRGDGRTLAQEICSQLGQARPVTIVLGLSALGLGLIPGMPVLPFFGIGLLLLIRAATIYSEDTKRAAQPLPATFRPAVLPLVSVGIAQPLAQNLHRSGRLSEIGERVRTEIFELLGLLLPPPEFHALPGELPIARMKLRGIGAGPEIALGADPVNEIVQALVALVQERPAELIDDIMTRKLLDYFESVGPDLVHSIVPGIISLTQLTELLKGLVAEGIPIRSLDLILQAIAECGPRAASERLLLEEVRIRMRRNITAKVAGETQVVRAVAVSPEIDREFVLAEQGKGAISPSTVEQIYRALERPEWSSACLLCSRTARRLIAECLAERGSAHGVIAIDELAPEARLDIVHQVSLVAEGYEQLAA